MKKPAVFVLSLLLFTSFLHSQVVNDTQIIEGSHWIYDAFNTLSLETANAVFTENSPLSAGELKLYLKQYDKDSLSQAGQQIYEKIENYLYTQKNFFKDKAYEAALGLKLAPELMYKSNGQIPWTYNYYYKSFPITVDVDTGFSNYISAGGDFFIGKNYKSSNLKDNFTNIPTGFEQIEFLFPKFCYGSAGMAFDNWGFNINTGKEGLKIGNTKTGSIIYNNTFETDGFIQLSAYTDDYKLTMNIIEISQNKFLYWHEFDARFWKKLKVSFMEGALINEPFEIRFINPMMIFHSFSFWRNYATDMEMHFYNESHCASYLGVKFEINPVKSLRFYALYSMNEMQMPNERSGKNLAYPDSFGLQAGAELKLPSSFDGYWTANLEGVYCSPYLYIKQAPDWSLYKTRMDMITFSDVQSWIGCPFGPDCFIADAAFGYEQFDKWSCGLEYLMVIKGQNDFSIFDKAGHYTTQKYNGQDVDVWDYYPYTKYQIAEDNGDQQGMDDAVKQGRYMWMTGLPEYKHQIALNGMYRINDKMKLEGQLIYSFIFNANHIKGNFQNGVQGSLSFEYNVF